MNARLSFLRIVALALVSAALVLGAAACGGSDEPSVSSGVVATVGGEEITQAQLDEVIAQAQSRLEAQGQEVPAAGSQEYQQFQQAALQYLVQRVEYAQKADELGVKVTDAQVQERLERVVKQFFGGSKKKYEEALEKQGITDTQVRDELRATLVSEGVFAKVGDSARVTDQEIEAYYNANPGSYNQLASREVRHILVTSQKLADDIYAQLQGGGNFAVLAKKYSLDSSKDIGGKLTIQQGETVPQFNKVAFELKVNEISKPLKTRFGWHVIQALAPVKEPEPTPLSEVKEKIRATLLGQKKSEAVTAFLQDLKEEYARKITYAKGFAPPATDTGTTSTG